MTENKQDWRIDHSAGRPILVYQNCSVIEAEQAEYVLRLIKADKLRAAVEPVAVLRYERGTPGRENEMPRVVSCNRLPDGDYPVYTAPQASADYQSVVDEALIVRHLGVASGDARADLKRILDWDVAVALDPAVSSDAQALIDKGRNEAAERFQRNLKDPNVVHVNMLRGTIAPITFDQLAHILGDEAMAKWIAAAVASTKGEDVKLPPLPDAATITYEFPDGAYDSELMIEYGRACYEAGLSYCQQRGGDALRRLVDEKFTSGNAIPVERITITRQEYDAFVQQRQGEGGE